MTRKIKFRAKVKHHDPMTNPQNGWVEGYYLQDSRCNEVIGNVFDNPSRTT